MEDLPYFFLCYSSVLDVQTKETQTPKTFFKDKAVLKKEVMQGNGTRYAQKAYTDANAPCSIDSSPSKDASITEETLDESIISEKGFRQELQN